MTIILLNIVFIWRIFCFLVKQVFSDMDFIGWYTTGDTPNSTDVKIHKQICDINESPILLKLNPHDKNIDVSTVFYYSEILDIIY